LLTLSQVDVIAYIASFGYFTNPTYCLNQMTSPPTPTHIILEYRGFTVYEINFQVCDLLFFLNPSSVSANTAVAIFRLNATG
jgi:hypothetical protein